MCPYDAPKYNAQRGIVRKCDLCSVRLTRHEAPACAQACPNEAIRVRVVDVAQAVEASSFLPGAPAPDDTLPTTAYRTKKELPRNLLAADFYTVRPEQPHVPLTVMLVLTQLSAGAFAVFTVIPSAGGAWLAWVLCLLALGASVLHLGRPRYAFRAILGLGTSWLSREIAAFSLFAALAALYAASFSVAVPRRELSWLVAGSGLLGVFCSVMVYEATHRPSWRAWRVGPKFFASTAVLGCATVLLVDPRAELAHILLALTALELAGEAAVFRHLRSRRHTALKRRAILMTGDLRGWTRLRFACGALGGLFCLVAARWSALPIFALVLIGELAERHLFFAAATAPRMPGGQA
jgi:DMSO reductase anchor subunit